MRPIKSDKELDIVDQRISKEGNCIPLLSISKYSGTLFRCSRNKSVLDATRGFTFSRIVELAPVEALYFNFPFQRTSGGSADAKASRSRKRLSYSMRCAPNKVLFPGLVVSR